jgi:NAD(P)H dehydrogenase (quinone)
MDFMLSVCTRQMLRHLKPRHRPLRGRLLLLPGLKAGVSRSIFDEPIIAITGATGYLGGHVARKLSEAGWRTVLVGRDRARLPVLAGARAVEAAYQDTAAMTAALEGVDRVFFVSGNVLEGRVPAHRSMVDACAAAGVERVIYTSFLGAGPGAIFTLSQDHYLTERYLQERTVPYVALRNSFYAEIVMEMVQDGVIRGPGGSGVLAPVARDDVVDAAFGALTASSMTSGHLDITGPTALSLADVAAVYARVTGIPARYEEETLEEAFASRARYNVSDAAMAAWVSTYQAIAVGELSAVTDAVRQLAGHAPMDFEAFLRKSFKSPDVLR